MQLASACVSRSNPSTSLSRFLICQVGGMPASGQRGCVTHGVYQSRPPRRRPSHKSPSPGPRCSLLISQLLVPGPSRPCWILETWFVGNCSASRTRAACLGPDTVIRFLLILTFKTSVKYSIFTAGNLDSGERRSLKKRLGVFFFFFGSRENCSLERITFAGIYQEWDATHGRLRSWRGARDALPQSAGWSGCLRVALPLPCDAVWHQ